MIYLITSICLQMSSTYNAACNSALTATTMQLGIKQKADEMQVKVQKDVENLADEKIGRKASVLAVAYFGYITQNQLVINTPIRPVADNLGVTLNPTASSGNLTLTWAF